MENDPVIEALREHVRKAGGQLKAAEQLGVTQTYISKMLLGRRAIPPQILAALGFEKKVVFVKKR